ncbi:GGDEF domain-containing protein [Amycolatopsis aidingensis]|uniref:GGDEF domain-containing protein n=1 Tax=Amycolatopsis aidingensis TaxID=2842453 RepID=UPI001C0DDC63|nr:GGDEF domain-containing protein [Amycolatopsis aidingensis]
MPFPATWKLWQQHPRVVGYSLACVAAVVLLTAVFARIRPPAQEDLAPLVILAGLGVLQAELGRQVERVRRRLSGSPYITMSSAWTFAAVLVVPPTLVAALVAVLYLHLGLRSWYRLHRVPPFRTTNNACCVILSCYAASAVLLATGVEDMATAISAGWWGAGAVLAALVVQFVVNAVLILPARNDIGRTPRQLFGGWADNGLDLATLCVGVFNGVALTTLPGLVVLAVPVVLLLHRVVLLVSQLEAAATRDGKTGVLNPAGWRTRAEAALARTERARTGLGLLMIDLDHFKQVNDTHGHPAGDAVLKAIATTITRSVRDHNDAVGRYGGEEFVVALPDIEPAGIAIVAERIRHAVSQLAVEAGTEERPRTITGLSVSVGTAASPAGGATLDALIRVADGALYEAKHAGRNRVVPGVSA